jgi:hypothetical protein
MREGASTRVPRARDRIGASFRDMQKLLLVSILIATVAIPVQMSRERTRTEGVKRTVKWMVGFCVFYLIALLYLYPRLEGL